MMIAKFVFATPLSVPVLARLVGGQTFRNILRSERVLPPC